LIGRILGKREICSSRILKAVEAKVVPRIEIIVTGGAHIAKVATEFKRVISLDPGNYIRVADRSGVSGLSGGVKQGVTTKSRQRTNAEIALRDCKIPAISECGPCDRIEDRGAVAVERGVILIPAKSEFVHDMFAQGRS
jgi:hypothetical protein